MAVYFLFSWCIPRVSELILVPNQQEHLKLSIIIQSNVTFNLKKSFKNGVSRQ